MTFEAYLTEWKMLIDRTEFYKNKEKLHTYEMGMELVTATFTETKNRGGNVYFVGNGGSSAIASHMTADYMKNGGMNTYSLFDNAVTTCMGNDYGYEFIFSKPLSFLMREGDLLVAISSSGNSKNICNAIEVAKEKKAKIITLSGFEKQNGIREEGDYNIYVPATHYGMVESIHNLILQQIVDHIKERDGAVI